MFQTRPGKAGALGNCLGDGFQLWRIQKSSIGIMLLTCDLTQ